MRYKKKKPPKPPKEPLEPPELISARRLATYSFLLGLLAFPFMCTCLSGLPAVILGGLSLERSSGLEDVRQIRRRAWIGIVLGGIGLLLGIGGTIFYYIWGIPVPAP